MPRVKVSDIEMNYECLGEGDPVVLVTGYGADLFQWALQAPELSQKYTVYMIDNRGVGLTDKPDGPYTVKMMADDVAGFFDAAGIEKAQGIMRQIDFADTPHYFEMWSSSPAFPVAEKMSATDPLDAKMSGDFRKY